MKLLFDENLSFKISTLVQSKFPGSCHVRDLKLLSVSDEAIWEIATKQQFVIISKDSDFYQKSMLNGYPPKIIWLNIGNKSTEAIIEILRKSEKTITAFIEDTQSSFLIIKE